MRSRSRAAVVGVLGVVALAVVATSMPAFDDGTAPGGGSGSPEVMGNSTLPAGGSTTGTPSLLSAIAMTAFVFVLVGYLAVNVRSTAGAAVGGVVVVATLAVAASVFAGSGPASGGQSASGGATGGVGGSGAGAGGEAVGLLVPVLVVAGLAVVGGGLVLARATGEDTTDEDANDGEAPPPEAVARAAGRAADRIRSDPTATDNEVYRCWIELVDLVDPPDREAYTPAEFENAATAAGMDERDVAQLRRLFEAVRYGGVEADREYERRAVDVLDRIEAAYDAGGTERQAGGEE